MNIDELYPDLHYDDPIGPAADWKTILRQKKRKTTYKGWKKFLQTLSPEQRAEAYRFTFRTRNRKTAASKRRAAYRRGVKRGSYRRRGYRPFRGGKYRSRYGGRRRVPFYKKKGWMKKYF